MKLATVLLVCCFITGCFGVTQTHAQTQTGTVKIVAYYGVQEANGTDVGSFVVIYVTIAGPQVFSGQTTTDVNNPLSYTLIPGTYYASGTYNGIYRQTLVTVSPNAPPVWAVLNFGSTPVPPLPTGTNPSNDAVLIVVVAVIVIAFCLILFHTMSSRKKHRRRHQR